MNTLDAWTTHVCHALDLDPGSLDRDLLLDLTKEVAHGVARPAAPLTAFLVGLAAGRAGGGVPEVRAACEVVARLAAEWPAQDSSR
ncbi:MAG: DUF6457 domain-containing protein [Actinobacteria bacterium]|jgi:hypothetical protein|nr:DUF6457 domain-containing protein [Actinomycetota bacterium]